MLYVISIIGGACLLIFCKIGDSLGWFKEGVSWFSRLMHFLGGFLAAIFASAIFTGSFSESAGPITYAAAIMGVTALIGVLWEIGEYLFGVYMFKKFGTRHNLSEIKDTIEDLFFDLAGALVFLIIFL